MWPTIVSIGPIAIKSFGVCLFLGVFFGGFSLWKRAKEEGWEEEWVLDSWILAGIGALVLSRVGFVLENWTHMQNHWQQWFLVTKYPGLSLMGAWLGGMMILLVLALIKKVSVWLWLEAVFLASVLVEIWARLGTFLAGSNLGIATSGWWGLGFPGVDEKRWPVQIFWVVGLLVVYKLLKAWEVKYRSFSWYKDEKGEARPGFVVAAYLGLIGVLKLVIGLVAPEQSRWWGISWIVFSGLILLWRSGKLSNVKLNISKKPKPGIEQKPLIATRSKLKKKRKKQGFDFK